MSGLGCNSRRSPHADEIALFLGTLSDMSTEDALANLEHEARLNGWTRGAVRVAAHEIRMRAARVAS